MEKQNNEEKEQEQAEVKLEQKDFFAKANETLLLATRLIYTMFTGFLVCLLMYLFVRLVIVMLRVFPVMR